MQRYFKNIESIDSFSQSLDYRQNTLQCKHCFKQNQFVSHGFVYKQRSSVLREKVGKRIFCSNRYGRTGCGRTFRLSICEELSTLQYGATHLFIFLCALIANLSVSKAYEQATGAYDQRNAWRWLNKLVYKLADYRTFLKRHTSNTFSQPLSRVKRLRILLPTIKRLFSFFKQSPCAAYQQLRQISFI